MVRKVKLEQLVPGAHLVAWDLLAPLVMQAPKALRAVRGPAAR